MNYLKERYFIRLSKAPPKKARFASTPGRVSLDEARNYKSARMILDWAKMEPKWTDARLAPTVLTSYSYEFTKVDINPTNPLDPLNLLSKPFDVKVPSGWETHVDKMAAPQMGNRPVDNTTR